MSPFRDAELWAYHVGPARYVVLASKYNVYTKSVLVNSLPTTSPMRLSTSERG
jgi:hypothetical protein